MAIGLYRGSTGSHTISGQPCPHGIACGDPLSTCNMRHSPGQRFACLCRCGAPPNGDRDCIGECVDLRKSQSTLPAWYRLRGFRGRQPPVCMKMRLFSSRKREDSLTGTKLPLSSGKPCPPDIARGGRVGRVGATSLPYSCTFRRIPGFSTVHLCHWCVNS